MNIRQITSSRNEKVKRWRKLGTRKGREEYGSILIEGEHLLEEAYAAGWTIHAVLVSEKGQEVLRRFQGIQDVPVYSLSTAAFAQLVDTQSPQGIAAEVGVPRASEYLPSGSARLLLLDAVQDPGNLGAIMRTAEAAGVEEVWLGSGTVDPYNPKVVRSAMGSLFRLRLRRVHLKRAIPQLKRMGFTIVSTEPRAEQAHFAVTYPKRTAVLLGNEGRGVSEELAKLADLRVRIPMPGKAESLNVSVTAGILLFEMVRQVWETGKGVR
jgi:RNA methyltransferase, TrmH family